MFVINEIVSILQIDISGFKKNILLFSVFDIIIP